jgi:hypothetical protein
MVSKRFGKVCCVESAGSGSEPGKGGVGFCGAGEFDSLDITNMFCNIPCNETKQILKNMLSSNTTDVTSSEILNCFDVITKQNYFTHGDKTITQTDGLAMGPPPLGLYLRFSYNILNIPTSLSWT